MVEHGAGEVKIGRMAVLPDFRNHGIGAQILLFLIDQRASADSAKRSCTRNSLPKASI